MTQNELLMQVASGKITVDEAAKLLEKPQGRLYCKVSAKGAVSLYGLQRMPVTLYIGQWERLEAFIQEVVAFGRAHETEAFTGKRKIDGKGEPVAYTVKVARKSAA